MNIKVAVRVRPFSQREKQADAGLCVDMMGPATVVIDPSDPRIHRQFLFDYSIFSFPSPRSHPHSQQQVYQLISARHIFDIYSGYNACVMAYGETGSGKTYTLFGMNEDPGIVPRLCFDLFARFPQEYETYKKNGEILTVCISMLEIYNERVTDLLVHVNEKRKDSLKIRERKGHGIYVEGLTKHPVTNFEQIEHKISEGFKNKNIMFSLMGRNGNRSATVLTLYVSIVKESTSESKILSTMHIADLPGSQRHSKTGVTGTHIRQSISINRSLNTLGYILSTLAQRSTYEKHGKPFNRVIPYRDSSLTRILQNSLGGNCKTSLICTVSPACTHYDETLSTLRYANCARRIRNLPVSSLRKQEMGMGIEEKKENGVEQVMTKLSDYISHPPQRM